MNELEEESNKNDERIIKIMEGMIEPLEWQNEDKHYI